MPEKIHTKLIVCHKHSQDKAPVYVSDCELFLAQTLGKQTTDDLFQ